MMKTAQSARQTAAGFYRWEDAGEPIGVYFHLNAVELIERDVVRAGKNASAGILLGKKEDGPQPTYIVENYEPIRHAAWKTTDSPFGDRRQLKAMMDRWASRQRRLDVLGFYRSCTTGQEVLTEDDLSLPQENPSEQGSLFLLIQPRIGQPSMGRVRLVQDGAVKWEWSPGPFSRAEISGRATPPRPDVRPSAIKSLSPRIADTPVPPPIPVEEEVAEKSARFPMREQWYRIAGALVVAVILALGILHFFRGRGASSITQPRPDALASSSLGFRFERDGADVRLIWNADTVTVLRATDGDLVINDGPITKTVHLDANDLKRGMITYSPLTNDLVFRLNVNSPDAGSPITESVRIISGLPSATIPQPLQPGEAASSSSSPMSHTIDSAPANPGLNETERAYQIFAKRPPVTTETGRVRSSSELITRPTKLVDNTVVRKPSPAAKVAQSRTSSDSAKSALNAFKRDSDLSSIGAAPVSNHPSFRQTPELIPVLPANSASNVPGVTSVLSKRSGGTVQPAQLISNGNPQYPKAAKEAGISGSVELRFKIGSTGDVYDVTVVKGSATLAEAAADSVRARKYKPARVDGVPTETDANAVFDFRLN